MAMTMQVNIVSAESEMYSGVAEMIFAPAELGELGIMPRHSALLTHIIPGEVRVVSNDGKKEESYYVSGGILEVQPHIVNILADVAYRAADLDAAAAAAAKKRAEEELEKNQGDINYAAVKAELAEAIAQLRLIEKIRKKKSL